MDILTSVMRRLIASIGAVEALAVRTWKFLSHLIFLEERRRLEHLRNENHEIQNMQAYEKLLAQHAKLILALGRDPREVDSMLSELMYARIDTYLKLNAMPVRGKGLAGEIRPPVVNRRFSDRRHIPDRRDH